MNQRITKHLIIPNPQFRKRVKWMGAGDPIWNQFMLAISHICVSPEMCLNIKLVLKPLFLNITTRKKYSDVPLICFLYCFDIFRYYFALSGYNRFFRHRTRFKTKWNFYNRYRNMFIFVWKLRQHLVNSG